MKSIRRILRFPEDRLMIYRIRSGSNPSFGRMLDEDRIRNLNIKKGEDEIIVSVKIIDLVDMIIEPNNNVSCGFGMEELVPEIIGMKVKSRGESLIAFPKADEEGHERFSINVTKEAGDSYLMVFSSNAPHVLNAILECTPCSDWNPYFNSVEMSNNMDYEKLTGGKSGELRVFQSGAFRITVSFVG